MILVDSPKQTPTSLRDAPCMEQVDIVFDGMLHAVLLTIEVTNVPLLASFKHRDLRHQPCLMELAMIFRRLSRHLRLTPTGNMIPPARLHLLTWCYRDQTESYSRPQLNSEGHDNVPTPALAKREISRWRRVSSKTASLTRPILSTLPG